MNGSVSRPKDAARSGARSPGCSPIACRYLVGPLAHPLERGEHRVVGRRLAQRDPRVRAGEVQRDPVEVALALRRTRRALLGARVARGARVLVGRALDDLDAVDLEHADRRAQRRVPAITRGRSQRRKASVIRPAAMPSRSAGRKSTEARAEAGALRCRAHRAGLQLAAPGTGRAGPAGRRRGSGRCRPRGRRGSRRSRRRPAAGAGCWDQSETPLVTTTLSHSWPSSSRPALIQCSASIRSISPAWSYCVGEVAAEAHAQLARVGEVAGVADEAVVGRAPEVGVGLDGHGEVGRVARPHRRLVEPAHRLHLLDLQQARRAGLARGQAGGDADAVAGLAASRARRRARRRPRSAPR